jgi:phytanoyl-CoA dioxygenase PhyH
MTALLGASAFPHPLSIARLAFPRNETWATPPHQDFPNNQGTEDLYACWMPLGDCPTKQGSLAILRGSRRLGLAPLEFSLGAGHRKAKLDERFERLQWVGSDFELGDAVIFHSLTVHRSLPNTTDRMRLSVDYRFQREGEDLTAGCLEPHFARNTWDEIYDGWNREDLKYYWRDKNYTVVPWDAELHAVSKQQAEDGIKAWMHWRKDRRDRHRRWLESS